MLRWSYVIPRLVLLGAAAAIVWIALDPLIRWAIIAAGQSLTSAKVEIGAVETSLWRTELSLSDVRVADPHAARKNLFEARQIKLALDADTLLRRKLLVREGRVSGLRFDTDRQTSGALDPADWHVELPKVELSELSEKWLDQLARLLKQELAEQAEQLESVRLARELIQRWPAEYEALEGRARSLRARIERLRELARSLGGDPVRTLEACQRGALEMEQIHNELAQLPRHLERLREQVLLDKDAALAAKERDLGRIRQIVRLDNVRPETLSEYLLGSELSGTITSVAQWVHWTRQHFPAATVSPQPVRRRGLDVLFPGVRKRPDLLIQSLAIDGEVDLGSRRVRFQGTASDLCTQPALLAKPVVLKAEVDAGTPLSLEAVLDRTGETPHDRVTINCPGIKHSQRVLGRPGRLALTISAGQTHLWVSLDLKGEELSGRVLIQQQPVELALDLGDCGGPRLAANLQEAMRQVRVIRVVADLSGTLKKPAWELHSNLGPQLAAALNETLKRELDARCQELAQYVCRQTEDQLARLQQRMLADERQLLARLDVEGTELQKLHQAMAQRLRLPRELLGKGLAQGLPLRF